MSFIEKTLMPGEEIKYRTKLSKNTAVIATVVFGVLGLAVIMIPIASVCLWAIPVWPWVKILTSEFVVTNRRILIKVGALKKESVEMLLSKVESIKYEQGLLDRLFGRSELIIVGTGGSKETFANIADPLEFRKQAQIQIEAMQSQKG